VVVGVVAVVFWERKWGGWVDGWMDGMGAGDEMRDDDGVTGWLWGRGAGRTGWIMMECGEDSKQKEVVVFF